MLLFLNTTDIVEIYSNSLNTSKLKKLKMQVHALLSLEWLRQYFNGIGLKTRMPLDYLLYSTE